MRPDNSNSVLRALLAVIGLYSCGDNSIEPMDVGTRGDPVPLRVMQYNLAGQGQGARGANIARHIADTSPDFVGAQECFGCDWLVQQLPDEYDTTVAPLAGVAIIYDTSTWLLHDTGELSLGDDDGWGERVASWALLAHADTGQRVYVYSTHWCVPIRSPDDTCDVARQLQYADDMLRHIARRAAADVPVVLMGDLNVFHGFERSAPIEALLDSGLVDVFRELHPYDDGATFAGNDWAPAGRIDYIFATPTVRVLASTVDGGAIAPGQGSDHAAVVATLSFADD